MALAHTAAAVASDATPAAPFPRRRTQPPTAVSAYPVRHVWHSQLLFDTHCAHLVTKHEPAIMQKPFDPTTMPGTHDRHRFALPEAHTWQLGTLHGVTAVVVVGELIVDSLAVVASTTLKAMMNPLVWRCCRRAASPPSPERR